MNMQVQQTTVVSAQNLPREIVGFGEVGWQALCQFWGMSVVGDVNASIFAVVIAPGWSLRPQASGGPWSFLHDDRGRERASVYYGSATNGEGARMYLLRRYNIVTHYSDPSDESVRIISGCDEAKIFREFGRVFARELNYFHEVERIQGEGRAWFDQNYAGWRDPFAFWDV